MKSYIFSIFPISISRGFNSSKSWLKKSEVLVVPSSMLLFFKGDPPFSVCIFKMACIIMCQASWHINTFLSFFLFVNVLNEIYMCFQAGDITLAGQIADKANPQAQEWLLKRISRKLKRWLTIESENKRIEK